LYFHALGDEKQEFRQIFYKNYTNSTMCIFLQSINSNEVFYENKKINKL